MVLKRLSALERTINDQMHYVLKQDWYNILINYSLYSFQFDPPFDRVNHGFYAGKPMNRKVMIKLTY